MLSSTPKRLIFSPRITSVQYCGDFSAAGDSISTAGKASILWGITSVLWRDKLRSTEPTLYGVNLFVYFNRLSISAMDGLIKLS